jgi:hypothetical protein
MMLNIQERLSRTILLTVLIVSLTLFAITGCGGGGGGSSSTTGTAGVWDQMNWDDSNWN